MFLGNSPLTPPLSQRQHFSFRAKCWLREGVDGHFPRNLRDQIVRVKFVKRASWVVDKDTVCFLRNFKVWDK